MSAPEVQVRVHALASPTGWAYWTCDGCGYHSIAKAGEFSLRAARRHSDVCKRLALARLQARWDARDTALRALVEKWQERQAKHSGFYGESSLADGYEICADELERAIGGGS